MTAVGSVCACVCHSTQLTPKGLKCDRLLLSSSSLLVLIQYCHYYHFFRSTSKSRPNNIRGGKNVRPSVRPQKVSSISMKFGIQVEVDE